MWCRMHASDLLQVRVLAVGRFDTLIWVKDRAHGWFDSAQCGEKRGMERNFANTRG